MINKVIPAVALCLCSASTAWAQEPAAPATNSTPTSNDNPSAPADANAPPDSAAPTAASSAAEAPAAAPPESSVVPSPEPASGPASQPESAAELAKKNAKLGAFLGVAVAPLKVTGLVDADISDWQQYGTGPEEGRVALSLGRGNTKGAHVGLAGGIFLGSKSMQYVAEIGYFPSNAVRLLTADAGFDWHFIHHDLVWVGLSPKLGLLVASLDLGTAHVRAGKTPPIYTPTASFNEGDSLSASALGFLGQLGLTLGFNPVQHFGLRFEGGYQLAYMGEMTVKAGGSEISKDDPALVKQDGTTRSAGIDPKVSSSGFYGSIALAVSL